MYRAELKATDGVVTSVAIKRLDAVSENDLKEMLSEMALLDGCEHAHLLPLLGYCDSMAAPCLIFPLMRGGSLACRLRELCGTTPTHAPAIGPI